MAIRGILFDKDGTLLDYHKTWMPVNRAIAARVAGGDPVLTETLLTSGGYDPVRDRMVSGTLLAAGNNFQIAEHWHSMVREQWPDFDELLETVNVGFTELCVTSSTPVTDLGAFVGKLKARGLRLGVATADSEAGIHASLGSFGILDDFDFLSGYDSGHGTKPDPDQVHGFMAATGLENHETMVVGDNLHDLHMGRSAGAGCVVGVLTGTSSREDLAPHADHVLSDITGIETLLDGFTANAGM